MTMKVRVLFVAAVILAEMWLVGCGHYTCGETFGNSSCSSSNGGLNQGNGNTTKGVNLLIADAGGIQGLVVDPTAKTIKTNPAYNGTQVQVDTRVVGDWMVIAGQKFMYTGYTATGEIWGWSLNGNGTLNAITGAQPLSTDYLASITSAGSQAMVANPAGTLLFALDQAGEAVNVYQIGTAGALTGPTQTLLPSGFRPYNLAVDGHGTYLYVSNIVGLQTTEVAIYSIGSSGALAAVGTPVASAVQQMQGEATGKFMIGTSGGYFNSADNHLYIESIGSGGALTETTATTQDVPVTVQVQPNTGGTLVYAFDLPLTNAGGAGPIEGFTLDASAGTLTAISGMSAAGANGAFDASGKYFFEVIYSNSTSSTLNGFDVSASPDLSSLLATVGWSSGAWAAYDAQ